MMELQSNLVTSRHHIPASDEKKRDMDGDNRMAGVSDDNGPALV
jgi:hypothetical protein